MVADNATDEAWGRLSNDEPASREAQMVSRYAELAALEEDERRSRLTAMARAEYALPDDKLRPFTVSRMRTWLALDQESAAKIAASYDAVMKQMPGPVAMRRVSMVQTLSSELTADEEERLRQLVPGLFLGKPARTSGLEVTGLSMEKPAAKKKGWAFWKS